jgi:hypothetical protein
MHNLLNQSTSFEYQSVNFEVYVVYQYAYSVRLVGWITEWNRYYVSALFVSHLELYVWFIKYRGYWVLSEDNRVATWSVMKVVSYDSWAIVVKE